MGIFLCQVKVGFPETLETCLNPPLIPKFASNLSHFGQIMGPENGNFSIFACNVLLYAKHLGLSIFIFTTATNLVTFLNCANLIFKIL